MVSSRHYNFLKFKLRKEQNWVFNRVLRIYIKSNVKTNIMQHKAGWSIKLTNYLSDQIILHQNIWEYYLAINKQNLTLKRLHWEGKKCVKLIIFSWTYALLRMKNEGNLLLEDVDIVV